MRNECRAGDFAHAINDVHSTRRKPGLFEPGSDLQRSKGRLLRRFQHAGAPGGKRGSEFPRGHQQRVIPGNDLAGDAHRFAQGETQGVCRNGIHVAENFVRKSRVVFVTSGHVRDIVFRFDDGLACVAALDFREMRGILPDFLSQFVEQAAARVSSRAALGLAYTKKKNAARPMKNNVPPAIQTSYEYKDVICCAGKKASAMPIEVVINPLAPAAIRVALLYRPFAKEAPAAIFRSAPNMKRKGINCSTTASERSF